MLGAKFNRADLYDVLVLEEDVQQRGVLLQPLEVDVSRILHPLQLGTLLISNINELMTVKFSKIPRATFSSATALG